jgi:hypothetical protein
MTEAVETVPNESDEGKVEDPIALYEEARREIDAVLEDLEARKVSR